MILLLLLENLKSKRSSEDFGKYSKNVTVYFNTWKSCFERLYLLNLFIECKNHFDELLEPFPNTIEMFTMLNEIGIKLFIVDEFLGPFSNYFYLKYLQCWMESPIWHSVLFPCHFILLYFFCSKFFSSSLFCRWRRTLTVLECWAMVSTQRESTSFGGFKSLGNKWRTAVYVGA